MNGRKVSVQAAGFAAAIIIVWAVKQWGKIDVPDQVVVAIGTLCSIAASILTPDDKESA